jgi:hypothetical protein
MEDDGAGSAAGGGPSSVSRKRTRADVSARLMHKKSVETSVIKMCLHKAIQLPGRQRRQVISAIQYDVQRQQTIAIQCSRLMNAYLIHLLSQAASGRASLVQSGKLDVTQNLIKQSMCVVSKPTSRASPNIPPTMLKLYLELFQPYIDDDLATYVVVPIDGMSRTNLQYLAKQMLTNYTTALEVNFERRTRAWIRLQLALHEINFPNVVPRRTGEHSYTTCT